MRKYINKLGLFGAVLAFALIGGATALALPPQADARAQRQDTTTIPDRAPTDPASQNQGATRLADAKLKACQNREKAITNIMSRIADRGQKQFTLFGTIADRTEAFYADKGNTLSNYDALVVDVNAKAIAAQAVLDTLKTNSTNFSCDGTDPKGFVDSFKSDLKAEISALQDYRTSVKNLIVGVKSVQGTVTATDATDTAGGN